MSNSDKAVKSSQAKTLYDDLRNRHEGVKESIAPEYADLTFPVTQGAHCFHEGVYYRAKQNIQTSEAWNPAHWETDAIEAELSSQKSAINVLEPAATSGDVGKFLKAKTVSDGKVTEYEFGEGGSGGVSDVKVNNVTVVSGGEANIPIANDALGVVKIDPNSSHGLTVNTNTGMLMIQEASNANVKAGTNEYKPVVPYHQHQSTFYGLAKAAGADEKDSTESLGTYTENARSAISQMLNAPVSVSGTTPSITAKAGVRYICGEVATLTIVVPATGIIDVVFESGSTATVLTVTPPTGVTAVKWANGFNPASLEANTVYELNIADGKYGVACEWT